MKKTSKKKAAPAKKSAVKKVSSSAGANTTGVMPLGDRVLVKPLSKEETGKTTTFGIIIPETIDKEKPEQGIVMAVGAGKRAEDGRILPLSVNVGDKVMFSKYGYDEIKINGVEYFIVSEGNILAVLK